MKRWPIVCSMLLVLGSPGFAKPVSQPIPAVPAVYVSNQARNEIDAFAQAKPHTPLGRVRIDQPLAVATDTAGTLYVLYYQQVGGNVVRAVAAFSRSGRKARYNGLRNPVSMAVGPDGSLYVVDNALGLVSYAPGATSPSQIRPILFDGQIVVDAKGVVYRAIEGCEASCGTVFAYQPGATAGTDLGFENVLASAAGITLDAFGNFVIADPAASSIDIISPVSAQLIGQISDGLSIPQQPVFDRSRRLLYVADLQTTSVQIYDYARGARVGTVANCPGAAFVCGSVAVTPAAL